MAIPPWKDGLSLGSEFQQRFINAVSTSKPGVSGLFGGSSVSGGRLPLSHTAARTSEVLSTTGVGESDNKRESLNEGTSILSWTEAGSGIQGRGEVGRGQYEEVRVKGSAQGFRCFWAPGVRVSLRAHLESYTQLPFQPALPT